MLSDSLAFDDSKQSRMDSNGLDQMKTLHQTYMEGMVQMLRNLQSRLKEKNNLKSETDALKDNQTKQSVQLSYEIVMICDKTNDYGFLP